MKKMIIAAAIIASASSALAASKSDLSNGGYGTAGCGLGALAFGNKSGPIQILAATLNGTAGSQTFGMSTGTSNCGPSVFAANETKAFLDNNAVALENDIVRGQGETLTTFSKMMNCDSQVLGVTLKNNYKSIYSGEQTTERVFETAQKVCAVKG
ncbi:DUF3015 domain-containing protein [Bdellovibrio sp. SKB1291214]|uniref:DUF3015 family protein n=1 Tax=Bdellovibrio sp. SKB1291214 TaxID=1732569 RepID=UPI000B51B4F1|nr:DUF3015 family protein [Bdellovibrio sp. SKB1291214]UYL09983.1 DUF3015 domain-containing protein [Bdellovibrio sp. SKB1291214]